MTPRERVLAAINGEPVDRVPVCFWYHFNPTPAAGPDSKMGQLELDFYNRYRPDILKVMHDIDFEPSPKIESADDWAKLELLDPYSGNFGKQLHTLKEIRAALDPDVPMLETVFGVYHYAEELSGGRLLDHIRENSCAVHSGLSVLADNLAAYAEAAVAAGAEGIYYALQGASASGATCQEYLEQFLGYDRLVLHAAGQAKINILHLHGYNDLYFDLLHTLPASAICWSDIAGGPSLAYVRSIHEGCLMCGVDEMQFTKMTREEIIKQGRDAIRLGGAKFILSPGCSIPTNSDPLLIDALRAAVE
jgi:uroporphyrinogen decarboxylase